MSDLRIIVTGNKGFIGRHVTKCIRSVSDSIKILGIDKDREGPKDPSVNQQLNDRINPDLFDILRNFHPHVIVNMAGQPDAGLCQADPEESWLDNVYAVEVLLKFMELQSTPRIVHASSAATYGRDTQNVYARDKMLAEYSILTYPKIQQKMILRFFNVYGPGAEHGVIPAWSRAIVNGQKPRIDADPQTVRDFVHVDDVAMAVTRAATFSLGNEICYFADVCTGVGTTLGDLAHAMGLRLDQMTQAPPDINVIEKSIGDPSRMYSIFRFHPRRQLAEEIASTIRSHRPTM